MCYPVEQKIISFLFYDVITSVATSYHPELYNHKSNYMKWLDWYDHFEYETEKYRFQTKYNKFFLRHNNFTKITRHWAMGTR